MPSRVQFVHRGRWRPHRILRSRQYAQARSESEDDKKTGDRGEAKVLGVWALVGRGLKVCFLASC